MTKKSETASEIRALKHVIKLLNNEKMKQSALARSEHERIGANRIRILRESGTISKEDGTAPSAEDLALIQEALSVPYETTQYEVNAALLGNILETLQAKLNMLSAENLTPNDYKSGKYKAVNQ